LKINSFCKYYVPLDNFSKTAIVTKPLQQIVKLPESLNYSYITYVTYCAVYNKMTEKVMLY